MLAPWAKTDSAAALRHSYVSVVELLQAGLINASEAPALQALERQYRLRIPRYYAALFDPDAAAPCPIRRQALPHVAEADPQLPAWAQALSQRAFAQAVPWRADAIGDVQHLAAPRLTHRYARRALLHVSSACALYCRFCFRKTHLNDAERPLYRGDMAAAMAYISQQPQIREVILTGGDPLSVSLARLQAILQALQACKHVRVIRLHSRMTATLPLRIDAPLCGLLAAQPQRLVWVSHFNHPRELTLAARRALRALQRAGVTLYNQTVLLRGVNDQAATLYRLFQRLYEQGVTPYYLHHADWTPGTFHFRVPIQRGQALMRRLWGRLSGPACPRYMLDLPGGGGKVQLLGGGVRLLQQQQDANFGGALYAITPPATRQTPQKVAAARQPRLYADIWARGSPFRASPLLAAAR